MREKLRMESVEPKVVKSSTDTEDAILPIPITEKADPRRANDLNDRAAPKCA
jgi:hypothetical protein